MKVLFADADLDRLETDPGFFAKLPPEVVQAYRRRMQAIRAAKDERDFRAMRSWNFEKLRGDRAGQWSIRLNRQWRLIVELGEEDQVKVVVIVAIEDYH